MLDLVGIALKKSLDVFCIQELYVKYGKLIGIPSSAKISQCSDSHMRTVELKWGGETAVVVNQYCQFRDPIEEHMKQV